MKSFVVLVIVGVMGIVAVGPKISGNSTGKAFTTDPVQKKKEPYYEHCAV
jgi:hypothetical protein